MTFGSTFGRTFSPTFQPKSQAAVAAGGTLAVNPVADLKIIRADATFNYGATATLYAHSSWYGTSLLRFDLSSIPSSATCTEAKLKITGAVATTWGGSGRKYKIYQLSSANGNWTEGTANGAAETGSPCYSYKAYDASTPTNWAGGSGCEMAGTDYVNTILAEYEVTDKLSVNSSLEIPFNASGLAAIKTWFGQSTNSGFLIYFAVASNFHSREASTESYRPLLTVTYS